MCFCYFFCFVLFFKTLNPVYHLEQEMRLRIPRLVVRMRLQLARTPEGRRKKPQEQLEPESWSQTQGRWGRKAMPDVEEVSVRVHLRVHGWGGKTGEDSWGKKNGEKMKWSSSSIYQVRFFFFFFFSWFHTIPLFYIVNKKQTIFKAPDRRGSNGRNLSWLQRPLLTQRCGVTLSGCTGCQSWRRCWTRAAASAAGTGRVGTASGGWSRGWGWPGWSQCAGYSQWSRGS